MTRRGSWLIDQVIAIQDSSPPEKVAESLRRIRDLLFSSERIEKKQGWPRVFTTGVVPGQIELMIQARVLSPDAESFLAERETVLLPVLSMASELGIEPAVLIGAAERQLTHVLRH